MKIIYIQKAFLRVVAVFFSLTVLATAASEGDSKVDKAPQTKALQIVMMNTDIEFDDKGRINGKGASYDPLSLKYNFLFSDDCTLFKAELLPNQSNKWNPGDGRSSTLDIPLEVLESGNVTHLRISVAMEEKGTIGKPKPVCETFCMRFLPFPLNELGLRRKPLENVQMWTQPFFERVPDILEVEYSFNPASLIGGATQLPLRFNLKTPGSIDPRKTDLKQLVASQLMTKKEEIDSAKS